MKRDRLAIRLFPEHGGSRLGARRIGLGVVLPAIVLLILGVSLKIMGVQEDERERTAYDRIGRVDAIHALGLQSDDPHKIYLASNAGLVRGYHDREWSRVGVIEDHLHSFAPHPSDPLTFFASGHAGRDALGLRRTADGGFTWTTIALEGRDLHAIALSPADPAVIYVNDAGTLRRTDDAGATWTPLQPPGKLGALAVSPTDANVVHAATEQGIARSDDAGETWRPLAPLRATVLIASPTNATTLLAGGEADAHLSTDGGVTWRALRLDPDLPITGLTIDPHDPGVFYAATEAGTLYKTGSGGTRWTQVWPG